MVLPSALNVGRQDTKQKFAGLPRFFVGLETILPGWGARTRTCEWRVSTLSQALICPSSLLPNDAVNHGLYRAHLWAAAHKIVRPAVAPPIPAALRIELSRRKLRIQHNNVVRFRPAIVAPLPKNASRTVTTD